jgi:hypothetical protein
MKPGTASTGLSFIRVVVGLALSTALALFDRQAAAASDELEYFHGCVSREIPAALRHFVTVEGYDSLIRAKADIVNSVFSVCRQRAMDSSYSVDEQSYVENAVETLFKQIPRIVELQQQVEQQWKSDPAKALEDQTVGSYSLCLQGTARRLSRASDDPPDAIEQGALAGCAKTRQIVFDTFSSHNKSYSTEAMTALEQEFHRKLPELVSKTRNDVRQATHR